MKSKKKQVFIIVWIAVIVLLAAAAILVGSAPKAETVQETMRDAVLHETGQVSLFGLKDVNPGLISGMVVTGILLIAAALIRIFAIPRFKIVPGRFQMLIEQVVGLFDNLAKSNSPWRHGFLGVYLFAVGSYIFVGTLFELLGVQAITVAGHPITLPAPLSDVNGAIAIGCLFLGNLLGSAVQLAGITVLQRLGVLELLLGLGIHILIIAFPFFHKSLDRFEKQKVKTAGQDGEV